MHVPGRHIGVKFKTLVGLTSLGISVSDVKISTIRVSVGDVGRVSNEVLIDQ